MRACVPIWHREEEFALGTGPRNIVCRRVQQPYAEGGVCKRHGAKVQKYTCSYEGCTNAQKGGVCI